MGVASRSAGAATKSVRSEERTLRTRQLLIAAGMHEFAAKGFDSASTKAIAARAGVAHSAVEFHFLSKEDLWRASAEKVFGEFHTTFGTSLETTADLDTRERVEALVTEAVVFFAQHPEFYRFITAETSGPRVKWLVKTHLEPLHSVFDALIADLDADFDGDAPDRRHLFYMFVGAAAAPYEMCYEFEQATGIEAWGAEAVTAHAESMIRTFLPPVD